MLFSNEVTKPCLALWLENYDLDWGIAHLYDGRGHLHTEDHSQNPPLDVHPVVSPREGCYFSTSDVCTCHNLLQKFKREKWCKTEYHHSPGTYGVHDVQLEWDEKRSQNRWASNAVTWYSARSTMSLSFVNFRTTRHRRYWWSKGRHKAWLSLMIVILMRWRI